MYLACGNKPLHLTECEETCSLTTLSVTENGTYTPTGYDGYSRVDVDVEPTLQSKTVTANGTVTPDTGYDGLSSVIVNVENTGKKAKNINFIDYDGTIIESYTLDEFSSVSSLPENPTHPGLVAEGWNYTLQEIQQEAATIGECDVGQLYTTQSGDTEFDVTLAGWRTPTIALYPRGTVEIYWGDGSSDSVTAYNSYTIKTATHTYAADGDYTVRLHLVSGSYTIPGDSSSGSFLFYTSVNTALYRNNVKHVRLVNVEVNSYGLKNMSLLEDVSVSNTAAVSGYHALMNCTSLKAIVYSPRSTEIMRYNCYNCDSLKHVSIPLTVTTISTAAFYSSGLSRLVIPSSVRTIWANIVTYCSLLKYVDVPPNATMNGSDTSTWGLGEYLSTLTDLKIMCSDTGSYLIRAPLLQNLTIAEGVTVIGEQSLAGLSMLPEITLPSTLTSIGKNGISGAMLTMHVKSTTPPTLVSNSLSLTNIQTIYVPQGTLATYQAAEYWSNYASYMQEE